MPSSANFGPDLRVSDNPFPALGLGCVTFGREIDHDASFAMMDYALAHGITLFDTAAAYGGGKSETLVGQWIAARAARTQVTLATKILPPYSPATIEAAVTQSLQRLGVAAVDVLFLHRWDESVADPDVMRALHALVVEGRVRTLGASNFSPAQLERALAIQSSLGATSFQALQNIHNLAVRGIDDTMRALCARAKIAIIAYSPLGAGFLTGKHETGVQPGSRFDIIPGHQNVYFNDTARRRLERLKTVADRTGEPMTRLALAWALHQPQIDVVLVGGRTPAHLDQALHARTFVTPTILRELDLD
jgi:aryl-alcohol dehydrogenase-like predicted oxidoreductase